MRDASSSADLDARFPLGKRHAARRCRLARGAVVRVDAWRDRRGHGCSVGVAPRCALLDRRLGDGWMGQAPSTTDTWHCSARA